MVLAVPKDHSPKLLRQRNREQNPAHHILRLEILLRAIGMSIVAADARLG